MKYAFRRVVVLQFSFTTAGHFLKVMAQTRVITSNIAPGSVVVQSSNIVLLFLVLFPFAKGENDERGTGGRADVSPAFPPGLSVYR